MKIYMKVIKPLILLLGLFIIINPLFSRENTDDKATWLRALAKPATLAYQLWDGNLVSTWHRNNGAIVDHNVTGDSGLEWPKGSGNTAIFAAGIWLAGYVDGQLRTAAAEYTREFEPGPWGGNPNDPANKIFRIYKAEINAIQAGLSSAEFDLDNDGVAESIQIPTSDYRNWPVERGAPFVDVDGDGLYDYEIDYPDILGDQFHWYVMNDGNPDIHTGLWATLPLDVEVQVSLFGFDRAPTDALGNTLFIRWVLINRGSAPIDSMFASIWHDDDVGDANDDFVGCDTTLSVGYTFNDGADAFYGPGVPVSGSDFFQGPVVDSPGDTATVLTWNVNNTGLDDLGNPVTGYYQRQIPGKRMLPMTSFVKYIRGDDNYGDPETAEEAYNYMNGTIGISGLPYTDPQTGEAGVFIANGDPVTNSGWLDSDRHPSGDRRFLMSSGPFTMAPGDTQEVVGCLLVGAGPDAITSIKVFKYFDKFAQNAFDANFDLCSPPAPKVELTQLDEKIILSWEEQSADREAYTCLGYQFQAYNLYQGESITGPWTLVNTFDVIDGVRLITDQSLDLVTGLLLELPVQFGSDAGLVHYIEIEDDYLNNTSLINNRKYYFTVTMYAYDAATAPKVIESSFKPIEAVPGVTGVGSILESQYDDALPVEVMSGIADADFLPTVISPYQLTNHLYEVTFDTLNADSSIWYLVDLDEMDTLYSVINDFPVSVEHYTDLTDGGAFVPPGVYQNIEIVDGFIFRTERATFSAPSTFGLVTVTDVDTLTPILFGGLNASADEGYWSSFIGKYYVNIDGVPAKGDLGLDIEFRVTDDGSIATYYDAGVQSPDTIQVPFEVWTIEDNRQINLAVYQAAGTKPVLGVHDSTGAAIILKTAFFMPVYEPYEAGKIVDPADESDKIGWMLYFNKDITQFESGDIVRINFNNPIVEGVDRFQFTGSGLAAASTSEIKSQIDKVNVFPNPYFGRNPEETDPQNRRVFFTHLGTGTATIRIFSLYGDLITTIEKEISAQNLADRRAEWNLRNHAGIPVASGMYIAHIELKDSAGGAVGEKVLKFAIFQPEERLDIY